MPTSPGEATPHPAGVAAAGEAFVTQTLARPPTEVVWLYIRGAWFSKAEIPPAYSIEDAVFGI